MSAQERHKIQRYKFFFLSDAMKLSRYKADWTEDRLQKLPALVEAGLGNIEIAKILFGTEIAHSAVAGMIFRSNLRSKASEKAPKVPLSKAKISPKIKTAAEALRRSAGLPTRFKSLPPPPAEAPRDISPFKATAKTVPEPALKPASVPADVKFIERTDDPCSWPVGETGEPGFHYCEPVSVIAKFRSGKRLVSPYCKNHTLGAFSCFRSHPEKPVDATPVPAAVGAAGP